ncbi:DUF1059 domain-containing protein [Nocardia salmonicida]
MKTLLNCPCGDVIQGIDEDELVEEVQQHLTEKHPNLSYDREQILSLAF